MTTSGTIPVLAASQFDPGRGRVELTLSEGLTLAQILRHALPGVTPADFPRIRVTLVTASGISTVGHTLWHAVRPKPGVRVVIRVIPGKSVLRSVLSVVVAIAAAWMAWAFAPALASATGMGLGAATSLIGTGVSLIGQLLINALVPPVSTDQEKTKTRYTISGWRNSFNPDGAVPVVLGATRYAPPFAAMSYSEIVGSQHYVRALFLFGEGEVGLTDFRIGETSIAEYDEIEMEVRYGVAGELPVSLYPRQILEESVNVELLKPLPRDDAGDVIDGPATEDPIVRTTAADSSAASIIIGFPGGLIRYYGKKSKKHSEQVSIRIEQRRIEAEEWQAVETLTIRAMRTDSFYRQYSWTFPSRGRWQVRVTILTDETEDEKRSRRTQWVALQSIRPEYPLNMNRPMALVAVRAKATYQLSGQLDNFSALVTRICPDWDHETGTWISRATTNPASLYRFVLQHQSNPKRVADNGIDLELLQDWHDYCRLKGLQYNRVLDQAGTSLRDALTEIAAAGRATPRHDGLRWGVVIDRPSDMVVDHIGPRNSWGFKTSRTYAELPDALVVTFNDETNDFKETQRIIRRPGFTGDIDLTEALPLPGITNPDLIWREALRRWYEIMYRPDTYEVTQDGAARVVTRGDKVRVNHDVLSSVQRMARVKTVQGNLILLDETVTMAAGTSYGIRFRKITEADTIGTSHVRNVATQPGETDFLTVTGTGTMPQAGDPIFFGIAGAESFEALVTATEATEDMCTILRLVDAAPEIEALTDAAEIPAWSGRIGAEIDDNLLQPSAPRWTRIFSDVVAAGAAAPIDYLIETGDDTIAVMRFRIQHRHQGASDWTTITIPTANGGGTIYGYTSGQSVELRAQALSDAEVAGPYGPTVIHLAGSGGVDIPAALDTDSIAVTTLLGGGRIEFATGTDASLAQVQLYRSTSAVLDRETDAVGEPLEVSRSRSYTLTVGDTTRTNLLKASAWTAGAGWTVSGAEAGHAPGDAGTLSQPVTTQTGRWYRVGLTVSGRTAGTVTPHLTGGSTVSGAAISADGAHTARLQAVSGNDAFSLAANTDFDGTVADLAAYAETSASIAQGTHYLWLEPQSEDGVPGAISGPFVLEVI